MTIWGFDISDYQGDFDMARAKREGFSFVIIKASEGSAWKSKYFKANLARARDAGLLTCGYHYQRSNASAKAQADNFASMAGPDVGFVPDLEANGGGVDLTKAIVAELGKGGYSSPLSYLPKWYWQQIGSPKLDGLAPLWQSHYPDNRGGAASEIYGRVPSSYWTGFGGQQIKILQYSSSATVAGRTPIDADAFEGSIQELTALLGGKNPGSRPNTPTPNFPTPGGSKVPPSHLEEFLMDAIVHDPTPNSGVVDNMLVHTGAAAVLIVQPLGADMCFFGAGDPKRGDAPVWCYGPGGGKGGGHSAIPVTATSYNNGDERRLTRNNPGIYDIPAGTTTVFYSYSSDGKTSVQLVPRYLLG